MRRGVFGGLSMGLILVSVTGLLLAQASDTPVADRAMEGDREAVRSLLKLGADVNAAQGDGQTALHWAAFRDDVEMAQMLIYAGANVDASARINAMTPLFMASQNGSVAMIETLLRGGADVNGELTTGATALMLAARSGSADAAHLLLQNGAQVDAAETARGQTALMVAAANNRPEVVRLLLENGADATLTTKVTNLAEQEAARERSRGRGGQAATAGRRRGGIGGPGAEAQGPPMSASGIPVRSGNQGSVGRQRPVQQRARGPRPRRVDTTGGLTALLFAAREGHLEAARALLAGGAEVNAVNPGDKTSPLLIAIINGHFDLGRSLLLEGADPTLASSQGATPLYATVNVKWAPLADYPQPDTTQQKVTYLDLMQELLDHGADPNVRLRKELWYTSYNFDLSRVDAGGATPFWRAAQVSDVAAMRLLEAVGADSFIGTNESVTPLHVATGGGVHGNDEIFAPGGWMPAVRYLVEELGADVNAVDDDGYTPLHNAASIGQNAMVQYLFDRGADVKAVSNDGETVADMANGPRQRIQPFPETIALLLKLGSPFSDNCVSC